MFVGHYAAAFALKGKVKNSSLGALFIATQFVDILFFPFAMAGIEHINFEEGFTEVNNFDMYFYPITHGLTGTAVWALLFYLAYKYLFKSNKAVTIAMALGVLSHWFADLLVHTPDLPILTGDPKFGLGLWNSKLATFGLEAGLLALSLGYYLNNSKAVKPIGKWLAIAFVGFLILVNYLNLYVLP